MFYQLYIIKEGVLNTYKQDGKYQNIIILLVIIIQIYTCYIYTCEQMKNLLVQMLRIVVEVRIMVK